MPNLVSLALPSLLIRQNSGIFDFRTSVQSLIHENCLNSRTGHDIDMKLGPVTKRYKRNMATSKKLDDDIKSANYDAIVIFLICGQFGTIRNPDS